MEQDLVSQGLELTLFGMGTVVVFLTLLVFVTSGMSALVARYFPEPPPAPPTSTPAAATTDGTLMAVITAGVHEHRRRKAVGTTSTQEQKP